MTLNINQVENLLLNVLSGNNELIRNASQELKKYLRTTESISTLSIIMSQNNQNQLRQLSCVLLKRCIVKCLDQLTDQQQKEFKTLILQRFFIEQNELVRKNIGPIIGKIANEHIQEGKWGQLFEVIQEYTNNNKPLQDQKKGFELFKIACQYCGDSMGEYYDQFFEFFKINLLSTDFDISYLSGICFLNIIEYIDKQKTKDSYNQLIPSLFQVIKSCVLKNEGLKGFELLDQLSIVIEVKNKYCVVHKQIVYITQSICEILMQPNIEYYIRLGSLDIILSICEYHKSIINKNNQLIQSIVNAYAYIISLEMNEQQLQNQDLDDQEAPIQDVALGNINNITKFLKNNKIFPPFFQIVEKLILQGQNISQIQSGFLILSRMTDNLEYEIGQKIEIIMNKFIDLGINHQEIKIKGACIQCITYLTEALGEKMTKYHKQVFATIIQASQSNCTSKINEKSLFAIDMFCTSLHEELIQYLPDLMQFFPQIPSNPNQNITIMMRRASISCYASSIKSVGFNNFYNYLQNAWQLMVQILQQNILVETNSLKHEALVTMGTIIQEAEEIDLEDKQKFYNSFINPIVPFIGQMMQNETLRNDFEVKEGFFTFFYSLATSYPQQFETYFDELISFCFKELELTDLTPAQKNQDFSLGSDSEDDTESLANDPSAKVNTIHCEEKAAAIAAIGKFALSCPSKFNQYYEKAYDVLETYYFHYYESIAEQSIIANGNITVAYIKSQNNNQLPGFKKGLMQNQPFSQQIQSILTLKNLQVFLNITKQVNDGTVVTVALETLTNMVKKIGPNYLHNCADQIFNLLFEIFENKLLCQGEQDDEEMETDEEEDTQVEIFESAVDLICAIAKVLREGMQQYFQIIFPSMSIYLSQKKEMEDNISMIGCMADIFKQVKNKQFIKSYQTDVLKNLQHCLAFEDDEMNRNLAFLLQTMCFYSIDSMKPFLNEIKKALTNMFTNTQLKATKENIIMAFCQIWQVAPDFVPIEQALDQLILQSPFIEDKLENKNALKFLIILYDQHNQQLQRYINSVIQLFVNGLAHLKGYRIKQNLEQQIIIRLKQLIQTHNAEVEKCVLQQEEKIKQNIIQKLK